MAGLVLLESRMPRGFTSERFADSSGWPLALIVFGIVMIGLSALAVRIDRDYVRKE